MKTYKSETYGEAVQRINREIKELPVLLQLYVYIRIKLFKMFRQKK